LIRGKLLIYSEFAIFLQFCYNYRNLNISVKKNCREISKNLKVKNRALKIFFRSLTIFIKLIFKIVFIKIWKNYMNQSYYNKHFSTFYFFPQTFSAEVKNILEKIHFYTIKFCRIIKIQYLYEKSYQFFHFKT